MKTFKGTKGEWFISEFNMGSRIITTEDTNVCQVFKEETVEGEANAKLIEAAPKLLEACMLVLKDINNQTTLVRVDLLEDAINKAL